MSQSAPPPNSERSPRAATYRALILAALFFAAALLFALLRGEVPDARVLILYAGVGLFVGGLVTAFSERRRKNGDAPTDRPRGQQTAEQLERRRRGQAISVVVGPVLFLVLAAISLWLFLDPQTTNRAQAIVFLVVFVIAAILSAIWALTARRATDRRIAGLEGPSA